MIYEMRTYTLHPGKVPEMIKHSGERSRAIRGDNFGKLEGYWYSEFGALNQVWHLWSYPDMNERLRLRGELGKLKAWTTEYVPLIKPLIVKQENRLLMPEKELTPPAGTGNIYEFRWYGLQLGQGKAWAKLLVDALPIREKYSKCVGVWLNETGTLNECSHLWVYPSFNERLQARAGSSADPEWKTFQGAAGPLMTYQMAVPLIPAPFSPMQ